MEARTLELVFPNDTNPRGRLFGGTLVAWMDKTAAYAAMRRARTDHVVTVAIDELTFRVAVKVGDLLELIATVESVGRTSMRVRVDVFRDNPDENQRELCTTGHFTMVSVDEAGNPAPVAPEVQPPPD